MSEARDVYGNAVGDILTVAALLRSIAENEVGFDEAFTQPKPEYVYRRKEWDVTITDSDAPALLIPANVYRTSFILTGMFPPFQVAEYSYGYPVPFIDAGGFQHWGVIFSPSSVLPSTSLIFDTQPVGGTVSIDDIYVTIPSFGLIRRNPTPFPILIAAFEQTLQPV